MVWISFVEFRGSFVLVGDWADWVKWKLGVCISFEFGLGDLYPRFNRRAWKVDFPVASLGPVFLALF